MLQCYMLHAYSLCVSLLWMVLKHISCVCLLCRTQDMQLFCLTSSKYLGDTKLVSAVARCASRLSANWGRRLYRRCMLPSWHSAQTCLRCLPHHVYHSPLDSPCHPPAPMLNCPKANPLPTLSCPWGSVTLCRDGRKNPQSLQVLRPVFRWRWQEGSSLETWALSPSRHSSTLRACGAYLGSTTSSLSLNRYVFNISFITLIFHSILLAAMAT